MKENLKNLADKFANQMNDMTVNAFEKSFSKYFQGLEETLKTMGMGSFLVNRLFDGGVIPAINSTLEMEKDFTESVLQVLSGEKDWMTYIQEMYNRVYSGTRYEELVQTLGKEIFGSAVYKGEKRLIETDHFTLTYIPAKEGTTKQKAALFHVGGILPYSDELFRFIPEASFFDRFIERGIPVYAMELRGDKDTIKNYGNLNLEKVIDTVDEFSAIAFKHNEGNKMIIEGYCGLGMQAMAFVMAKPKEVEERFKVAMTMVSPIDGSKTGTLAEMMLQMPQHMLLTQFTISSLMGGYVSGDSLRRTQDLALRGFFPKTPFGRFVTGWKNKEYANVKKVSDLTLAQKKDLAGAYWISPQNCNRFPVPVDIAKYSSRLFRTGVNDNGDIPFVYKGQKLSFQTPLKQTKVEFVGFYGAKDRLVPEITAQVLKDLFKDRYSHVVHGTAGHVSYVLSPEVWDKSYKKPLDPNPIDVLLKLYNK